MIDITNFFSSYLGKILRYNVNENNFVFDVQVGCLPVKDDYIGCFLFKGIPPASFNIYFKRLILNIFIKDCARLEIV